MSNPKMSNPRMSLSQALAGQIIFAYFQYFASCGYALLPDNSFSSFVMIILIALLSGTCSVCRMHYETQTASDKHCRCLGTYKLYCISYHTVQHLSRVVWLDIPSRFSWYSANYHSVRHFGIRHFGIRHSAIRHFGIRHSGNDSPRSQTLTAS